VVIAVSSAHRKEALEAAHFAIDTLKATVPIWKKEFYAEACEDAKKIESGSGAWKENKEWHAQRQGL
jgi:molybdopterin synthase catalytic subunit